jgi:hypothetical protein
MVGRDLSLRRQAQPTASKKKAQELPWGNFLKRHHACHQKTFF